MICKNCGFKNTEGDEFCGSCGQFLEWTGVKADGTEAPPPPPVDDSTMAMPVPPPPPPPVAPPPPPPPPGMTQAAQPAGRAPDIICWNCARRNGAGRTFCIQCGERLTAGKPTAAVRPAAVATGAAVTGPPPTDGGGVNRKMIAIAIGLILALVVVMVVGAAFLGGNNPPPSATPTLIAGPTATTGTSPSGTVPITPTPSVGVIDTPTLAPTLGPTLEPTLAPTLEPTLEPTPQPTPKPTKQPTPKPTAPPIGEVCNSPESTKTTTMTTSGTYNKRLGEHTAWCPTKVVFIHDEGHGLLKIYLINDAFSPRTYGWLEVTMPDDFGGFTEYEADLNSIPLPDGYDNIPPDTVVRYKITCYEGPCHAALKITYWEETIP